ncbi:hypothetical protein I4I78_10725 [Pseudonocardia sp. KRD-291]|nr:hypothetical protein [Pseudonocardia sp. KRD291]
MAERLAAAVTGCPSVARLHGGPFGEVATYLPGRRVTGIRISGDDTATDPALVGKVAVHVAGRYPHPVSEIVREVRAAVGAVMPGLTVEGTVEDYL